jgi:integrase
VKRGTLRVAEVWDNATHSMSAYPKGRKIRDVPIPDWVLEQVEPLLGTPGRIFGDLDIDNWRKRVWLPTVEAAGLQHVRIHDLRHTYASTLLSNGASLAQVGLLLGHESPETTQRYAHWMEFSREDVVGRLKDPRGEFVGEL